VLASAAQMVSRAQRGLELVVALLLLVLPLAVGLQGGLTPMSDPDVWWHLAAGRWILDHGKVPDVDPFLSRGVAREWLDYSWSIDASWWAGYRAIGLAAPVIYAAVLGGLLLVVCAALTRSSEPARPRRAFAAALGFVALGPYLPPRTYLVTVACTGCVLLVVRAARQGAALRRGWLLLPMFALWANAHVEFVYGLFFLGLATLDAALGDWRAGRLGRGRARDIAMLTGACAAATLANAFGPRLHGHLVEWSGTYAGSDMIFEMQSLAFRSPQDYLIVVLFAAAVYAKALNRDRSVYGWVALAFAAQMSFHSRRASWMVVLVSLESIATLPILSATRPGDEGARVRPLPLFPPLAALIAAAVAVFSCLAIVRRDALAATDEFPFEAARFARDSHLPGPVYNHYNWGGFLRFELPEVPGNIDGRGTLFTVDEIRRASETWAGAPDWASDEQLSQSGFVFARKQAALAQLLRWDPRFYAAYEDDLAVLFVHKATSD
jgi:hypothetical protein